MNQHNVESVHFNIILKVETLSDGESPKVIFDRVHHQVMEDMILDCQTVEMVYNQDPMVDEINNDDHQKSIMQDQMSEMDLTISDDLIEAYKGYYEDEGEEFKRINDRPWDDKIREMITMNTPKKRLEIYCEWNGILGYHSRFFEIATGEL